jgi:HlyD family secretion protein
MKKVLGILVALVLVAVFIGTGVFLYRKSQAKPVVYATESPVRTDIIKKTVATGSVVPRKEVELKPVVSGIIDELYVEPGQVVKQGELIARVQLIPNMVSLSSSESRVNRARIALDNAQKDLERNRGLAADGTISASSFQQFELAYNNAKEELQAAVDNLDLIRKGTSARRGNTTNTLVRATISGMVLEVPVEVGSSVIEANNFNAGTTIATLADMTDMIFEGKVDESEVGKIKPGMALLLTIGAAQDRQVKATLERIAPKGVAENGAIQFEIRAAITPQPDLFIRANYSANADIVLDRHDQVVAINEALLQFDEGKPYVEVETAPQRFARRDIETGLSDGIQIEVVSGLSETDKVKNPSLDTAAAAAAGGGARTTGLAQTRPRRAG